MLTITAILGVIPAFIQALPYLAQVMLHFMNATVSFVAWSKKKELTGWIQELEGTIDALIQSKTPEEKLVSARKLSDLIGRIS